MDQEVALDRVAVLEAESLLKLVEMSGRRALVALVVAQDNGDCTVTAVPSADTTLTHVTAFAVGLEREAARLRDLIAGVHR